jgi:hypothetical protein
MIDLLDLNYPDPVVLILQIMNEPDPSEELELILV